MFEDFGEIESAHVQLDEQSNPKDYGYVCFKLAEIAEKALNEMNKKKLDGGNFLMVSKHISKKEN